MAKRRSRKPAGKEGKKPLARSADPSDRPLIEKPDYILKVDPPNQLLPLQATTASRYPLTHARLCPKGGDRAVPVFVDPDYQYDADQYFSKPCLPPTWMDPERFAALCLADPAIQDVLDKCLRQNSRKPAERELPAMLTRVFDDQYLPEVLDRFAETLGLFSQWLPAHWADKSLDEAAQALRKRRQRKPATTAPDEPTS